jgi:citrate synthase
MAEVNVDLFPLMFAVSRIAGWTAHVPEQYGNNKLIRPLAEHTGPQDLRYVPISRR